MNEYEKMTQQPIEIEFGKYRLFFNRYIFENYLNKRLNIERIDEFADEFSIKFSFIAEDFDLDEDASMNFDAKYKKDQKFIGIKFSEEAEDSFFYETFKIEDFKYISICK